MKVVDFLEKECLVPTLSSDSKEGILRELVACLCAKGIIGDVEKAVTVLLEREGLGSTGIGEGIAIPHGKLPELDRVVAVFGRSVQGVDFDAMDGEPVHLFFLLMAPENAASDHLKALARISRLLKTKQFRQELLALEGVESLFEKIRQEDETQ